MKTQDLWAAFHSRTANACLACAVTLLVAGQLGAAPRVINVPATGGRYAVATGESLDLRFADALVGLRHVGLRVVVLQERPTALLRVSVGVGARGTLYFMGTRGRVSVEMVGVATPTPRATPPPRVAPAPVVRRPTPTPAPAATATPAPSVRPTPTPAATPAPTPKSTVAATAAPTTPVKATPTPRVVKIGREEGLPGQRRVRLEEARESDEWLVLRFRVLGGKDSRVRRVWWQAGEIQRVESSVRGSDLWLSVWVARALATKRSKVSLELEGDGRYTFPLTSPTVVKFLESIL